MGFFACCDGSLTESIGLIHTDHVLVHLILRSLSVMTMGKAMSRTDVISLLIFYGSVKKLEQLPVALVWWECPSLQQGHLTLTKNYLDTYRYLQSFKKSIIKTETSYCD